MLVTRNLNMMQLTNIGWLEIWSAFSGRKSGRAYPPCTAVKYSFFLSRRALYSSQRVCCCGRCKWCSSKPASAQQSMPIRGNTSNWRSLFIVPLKPRMSWWNIDIQASEIAKESCTWTRQLTYVLSAYFMYTKKWGTFCLLSVVMLSMYTCMSNMCSFLGPTQNNKMHITSMYINVA